MKFPNTRSRFWPNFPSVIRQVNVYDQHISYIEGQAYESNNL